MLCKTARRRRRRALLGVAATAAALLAAGAGTAWAGTFLPERGGSANADRIASLYTVVFVLAALVFAGVAITLAVFLVRYRARRGRVAAQIHGHTRLEIAWTVAATLLILFLAVFSLAKLPGILDAPRVAASSVPQVTGLGSDGALHIQVDGRQFIWMYRYPGAGRVYSYEEMVAPVGVTVKLDIKSVDVDHSWWIPKLGGKHDAIPGYVNHTWFRLERRGVYRGQCAELCGRNHANMTAQVRGVSPAAYDAWIARQGRLLETARLQRGAPPDALPAQKG